MPRIENDIKLDFKDVLLRPKRSTLKSRSEVGMHEVCLVYSMGIINIKPESHIVHLKACVFLCEAEVVVCV